MGDLGVVCTMGPEEPHSKCKKTFLRQNFDRMDMIAQKEQPLPLQPLHPQQLLLPQELTASACIGYLMAGTCNRLHSAEMLNPVLNAKNYANSKRNAISFHMILEGAENGVGLKLV